MANTAAKFGFRHIGYLGGAAPDYQMSTGVILASNATKIFRGDPVVVNTTTGKLEQAVAGAVTVAGVFEGCMYTPVGGTPQWSWMWPGAAGVDAVGYFIDAPNALFMAAALSTSLLQANVGENVGFNIGVGNTVTGMSAATIDQATLGTTATLPFRVVAPVTASGNFGVVGNGNDPTTPFGWAIVAFNNQNFKTLTGLI